MLQTRRASFKIEPLRCDTVVGGFVNTEFVHVHAAVQTKDQSPHNPFGYGSSSTLTTDFVFVRIWYPWLNGVRVGLEGCVRISVVTMSSG
jgi:hypothetical protein